MWVSFYMEYKLLVLSKRLRGKSITFPTDFFDLWRDLSSYLKGLKEAPSPSTPIFHFVIFASNTHHGLAVQVEFLIKGL